MNLFGIPEGFRLSTFSHCYHLGHAAHQQLVVFGPAHIQFISPDLIFQSYLYQQVELELDVCSLTALIHPVPALHVELLFQLEIGLKQFNQ